MKNSKKLFGIIALVAIIGFSMTACDDGTKDNGGGGGGGGGGTTTLSAPVLTAQGGAAQITLSWTAVSGASGYNVYVSDYASTGFDKVHTEYSTGCYFPDAQVNRTFYFKVAAFSANGTEGPMSNVASGMKTGGGGSTSPLNGVWKNSSGTLVMTVSGTSGIITSLNITSALWLDAINKGYVKVGDQFWRNITSTGTLTWSAQEVTVHYNTNYPNIAESMVWTNITITMSANGQTLTASVYTGSQGAYTVTYTRQ